jgi:acylphosphatase
MATHLRITGVVQGVGYRYSFERQARALKLAGWVRNCRDGSVEAVVRGEPQAVEEVIRWARRGPPQARVQEVTVTAAEDGLAPDDRFETLPTV